MPRQRLTVQNLYDKIDEIATVLKQPVEATIPPRFAWGEFIVGLVVGALGLLVFLMLFAMGRS